VLKKAHRRPGQLYSINNLYSWVKLRVALTINKTVLTAFLTHAVPVWGIPGFHLHQKPTTVLKQISENHTGTARDAGHKRKAA
jgi:hypothetical protein